MADPIHTPDVGSDQLASVAGRGIAVNYTAQLLKFVLHLGYQIAIARLLLPEQFGIVAMASPVIAFAALVADLGLSQAAIQHRELKSRELNLLFWANLTLTCVFSIIIILCGPLIARFYDQPLVAPVVTILAVTMLIGALGTQHMVLLNRQLRFGTIATIDLLCALAGALASLAAALAGFGLWAIVIYPLVSACFITVTLWIIVRWRPSIPRDLAGAKNLIGVGADVAVANTANFFARNLDNILIGKVWGEAPLGAYDRAYRLLLFPLAQVTAPMAKIAVPLLSRVQHDVAAYRRAYFLMLELILGLTYPGAIMALVTHEQLIRVLLGEKWMAAAPIFAILAVGALFAPIGNSTSWLLVSQGRTRRYRNYAVISSIAFAAGIVAGLPWGPVGVAAGYIGVGIVQGPLTWWLVTGEGPVDRRALAESLLPFVLAGVAAFAAAVMLQQMLPEGLFALLSIFVASYCAFLLAILAQRKTRESFLFLVRHLREIVENRIKV